MEPKKDNILSRFSTSGALKKMLTQLLLSLSIFSFVFSYYSLCSHPRKWTSAFMSSQSHAVNKNYIFLICNALLVFLSKTSGLLPSSSGFNLNDTLQKRVCEEGESTLSEETKYESDQEYLRGTTFDDHDFEADEDEILIPAEETESCSPAVEEEDEYTDGGEVAELSNEELNKKFEEFIRKTKEEIMMNEDRQLVIVK